MRNYFFVLLALLIICLNSCNDFLEKDITGVTPTVIIPTYNDSVAINPVHFKWNDVVGASKYHLEVVSPSFANIKSFNYDTIVTSTDVYLALDSALYEFKLTALNQGYFSKTLGPIPFAVGVSPSGSANFGVQLLNPLPNIYLNSSNLISFSWTPFVGTSSYEFSLRSGSNFSNGAVLFAQNAISTSSLVIPNTVSVSEGTYSWGVKSYFNSTNETVYSTRIFHVDNTAPNAPGGTMTPSGTYQTGQVTFTWSNGIDVGLVQSPVTSYLEVSTDNTFGNIVVNEVTVGNSIIVSMTSIPVGNYYWRVKNVDQAGNSSAYSTVNTFYLN